MVRPAHTTTIAESHIRGRIFWMMRLLGIWPTSILNEALVQGSLAQGEWNLPGRSHREEDIVLVSSEFESFFQSGHLNTMSTRRGDTVGDKTYICVRKGLSVLN